MYAKSTVSLNEMPRHYEDACRAAPPLLSKMRPRKVEHEAHRFTSCAAASCRQSSSCRPAPPRFSFSREKSELPAAAPPRRAARHAGCRPAAAATITPSARHAAPAMPRARAKRFYALKDDDTPRGSHAARRTPPPRVERRCRATISMRLTRDAPIR